MFWELQKGSYLITTGINIMKYCRNLHVLHHLSFLIPDFWAYRGGMHYLPNPNSSGLERVINFYSKEHRTVTTSKCVPQAWIYWEEQGAASALVSIMQNTH